MIHPRTSNSRARLASAIVLAGSAAWAALPVHRTSGRFLLDPCGDTVVIRGVEMPVHQLEYLPEYAKTKGNFVRILVDGKNARWTTPLKDLDSMLALARRLHLAVDLSIHDTVHVNGAQFVQPDVLPMLKRYEDILTLHAQGEGRQTDSVSWIADGKAAIDTIRKAGLRCPLFILSNFSGRNPRMVADHGQKLVDHDPERNILLGVQIYWGYTASKQPGWFLRDYGSDSAWIAKFAQMPFPVIAGINNLDPYGDPWMDYETQMAETLKHRIGWFWWDWNNPFAAGEQYHLAEDGKYGNWGEVRAGGPDLDFLVAKASSGAETKIEAENFSARLGRGYGRYDHPSTSGGAFLCCGNAAGDFVEYSLDGGSVGGDFTITARYANGESGDKKVRVRVGGDSVASFRFPFHPGASDANFWRAWTTDSVRVRLAPGDNTLRLEPFGAAGPFPADFGVRAVLTHPGSLEKSSKRTWYMQNGSCREATSASRRGRVTTNVPDGVYRLRISDLEGRVVLDREVDSPRAEVLHARSLPAGIWVVRRTNKTVDGSGILHRTR